MIRISEFLVQKNKAVSNNLKISFKYITRRKYLVSGKKDRK